MLNFETQSNPDTGSTEQKAAQVQEDVRNLLAKGQYDKVRDVASPEALSKSLGVTNLDEITDKLNQVVAPIIRERTAEMIRQGDGKNLKKMLSSEMKFFGTDILLATEGLSKEELHNPEIVAVINEHFVTWTKNFSGENINFMVAYINKRDSLVSKGFATAEEFNHLPDVQKKMKAEIMERAKSINSRDSMVRTPEAMRSLLQSASQTGVFTEYEIADLLGIRI
jgi:uncharacterized protein YfkK (UPF0435 family)